MSTETSTTAAATSEVNAGEYSVSWVTVPNQEVATKLASGLVESRLAACVNILPGVTSIYTWEGKVNQDSELLLMIKSRTSLSKELQEYVRANHPYQVPEVITVPLASGHPPYLQWIGSSTKDPSS